MYNSMAEYRRDVKSMSDYHEYCQERKARLETLETPESWQKWVDGPWGAMLVNKTAHQLEITAELVFGEIHDIIHNGDSETALNKQIDNLRKIHALMIAVQNDKTGEVEKTIDYNSFGSFGP